LKEYQNHFLSNIANRKVQFWEKSVNQLFLVTCWLSLQFFARYLGRKVRNLKFLPHFETKNKRGFSINAETPVFIGGP